MFSIKLKSMAISFGHLLSSLLLFAFIIVGFESRVTISNEESIKRRSTTYHEDDLAQVTSHSLHERFGLENQNSNKLHWKPSNDHNHDDEDDSQIYTKLALASQVKGEYYGVQATMDVYNLPEVGQNQCSSSMMSLLNTDGGGEEVNALVVGWHICPERYGDHYTHFFIIWEGREQVCLNLECQGFVLDKSSKIVPGSAIQQSSGRGQNITIKISKNESSGDWWLHYDDQPVGYWPKSIFSSLADNASLIGWGGQVFFQENQKSPPMGSGHFPSEGKEKAASMSNINIILRNGELVAPKYSDHVDEDTNCYQISTGDVILYGGPGGCKE